MLRFLFLELDHCSLLLELDSEVSALEEADDEEDDEDEDEEAGATALEKARASGPPALAWRFQSKRRAGGRAESSALAFNMAASSASVPQRTTSGPGARRRKAADEEAPLGGASKRWILRASMAISTELNVR